MTTAELDFPDDQDLLERWNKVKARKAKQVVVVVGQEESQVCGKTIDRLKRGKSFSAITATSRWAAIFRLV